MDLDVEEDNLAEQFATLSTVQKIQQKSVHARSSGYDELLSQLETTSPSDPTFQEYLPLLTNISKDSLPTVLEKSLTVVLKLLPALDLNNFPTVIIKNVLDSLKSERGKSKQLVTEIIMTLLEFELTDDVCDALLACLSGKNNKIIVSTISVVNDALSAFGPDVITTEKFLQVALKLITDRSKPIRDATRTLVQEFYRWKGPRLDAALGKVDAKFLPTLEYTQKPKPTRYLKSKKPQTLSPAVPVSEGAVEVHVGADEQSDEDDYPEVNILDELKGPFYAGLGDANWQVRRDGLIGLEKCLESAHKLAPGDYSVLVKALCDIIKADSNLIVLVKAAKSLLKIIRGLRNNFRTHSLSTLKACVSRFKESKASVVEVIRATALESLKYLKLDEIRSVLMESIVDKNPSIKKESIFLLTKALCSHPPDNKQLIADMQPVIKLFADRTPLVREGAYEAVAMLKMSADAKTMATLLMNVDPKAVTRINECYAKMTAGPSGAKTEETKKQEASAKEEPPAGKKPVARPKKPPSKTAVAKAAVPASNSFALPEESALSDFQADEMCEKIFGADLVTMLADTKWSNRDAAAKKMLEIIKTLDKVPTQAIAKLILKKPGMNDSNVLVLQTRASVLEAAVSGDQPCSKLTAELITAEVLDKIGHQKAGKSVQSCLTAVADASSHEIVARLVLESAVKQKSPLNKTACYKWVAETLPDFGFKLDAKALPDQLKHGLANPNENVRKAALGLAGVAYLFLGGKIARALDSENNAQLKSLLDAEFEQYRGQKPLKPTKGFEARQKNALVVEEDQEVEVEEVEEEADEDELVERKDISSALNAELMAQFTDSKPKIRTEGVDKVADILKTAGFIKDASVLHDLFAVLNKFCGESNLILSKKACNVIESFATALNKTDCLKYVKSILPGLLGVLGNSKEAQRKVAVDALDAWCAKTTLFPMLQDGLIIKAFQKGSPMARMELYTWLARHLKNVTFGSAKQQKIDPEFMAACANSVLEGVQQSNQKEREAAQVALPVFVTAFGAKLFNKTLAKLPKASQTVVEPKLEAALKTAAEAKALSAAAAASSPKPVAVPRKASVSVAEVRVENEEETNSSGPTEGDNDESMTEQVERVDISASITAELLARLADKNPKTRTEALDNLIGILKTADHIQDSPVMHDLFAVLCKLCSDSNQFISKKTCNILASFASALPKSDCVKYARAVIPDVLTVLGSQKDVQRKTGVETLEAWHSRVGVNPILQPSLLKVMEKGSPLMRAELYTWLPRCLQGADFDPKKLDPEFGAAFAAFVLDGVQQSNAQERKAAQDGLFTFVQAFGSKLFNRVLAKQSAAVQNAVSPRLEAVLAELAATKSSASAGGAKPKASDESAKEPGKKSDPSKRSPGKGKKAAGGQPAGKAPLVNSSMKAKRAKEWNMSMHWFIDAPKKDHFDMLKKQLYDANVNPDLIDLLMNLNVPKQMEALNTILAFIEQSIDSDAFAAVFDNTDLLFKWVILTTSKLNPAVLMRCIDLVELIFSGMIDNNLHLSQMEVDILMPQMLKKFAENKDNVRLRIRNLCRLFAYVGSPKLLFNLLTERMTTKNNSARRECLECLATLAAECKSDFYRISALRELAGYLTDSHQAVNAAAWSFFVRVYDREKGKLFTQLDKFTPEQRKKLIAMHAKVMAAAEKQVGREVPKSPMVKTAPGPARPVTAPVFPEDDVSEEPRQQLRPRTAAGSTAEEKLMMDEKTRAIWDRIRIKNVPPIPQLPELQDLTELEKEIEMLQMPLDLPEIQSHKLEPLFDKVLMSLPDVASAINYCVVQISSPDAVKCSRVLAQIDRLIQDDKHNLLLGHLDAMVDLLVVKLDKCHTELSDNRQMSPQDLVLLLRSLLSTVHSLFSQPQLAQAISENQLRKLLVSLINLLLHRRLEEQPEGANLVRSINTLCGSILKQACCTHVLCVFIKLLHEATRTEETERPTTRAYLKSIWRLARAFPERVDEYDWIAVLKECQYFMAEFPNSYWKTHSFDLPIRTIKSVLYQLCQVRGPSVVELVEALPNSKGSELETYVVKSLYRLTENGKFQNHATDSKRPHTTATGRQSCVEELRAQVHSLVDQIMEGDRESALHQLHELKQAHPSFDIAPQLDRCPDALRRGVVLALRNLGYTQRFGLRNSVGHALHELSENRVPDVSDLESCVTRLRAYRKKLGLPNEEIVLPSVPSPAHDEHQPPEAEEEYIPPPAAVKVDAPRQSGLSDAQLEAMRMRLVRMQTETSANI